MSQYVTLTQLKDALGIDDTVDDGDLQTVSIQASGIVDEYLRSIRPGYVGFASASNTRTTVGSNTRVYDGTGDATLFIDDADTVVSVAVDTVAVSSNSWRLWPYNEKPTRAILYADPTTDRIGLTSSTWTRGTANVSVHAYFGMPFVPDDVQSVTMQLAVILWRRWQKGEFTGSSTALNVQRFAGGAGRQFQYIQDPEIAAVLAQLDYGWSIQGVWGG